MINVIIADDHTIVREGLRRILDLEEDILIVAEAETGQEVLDLVKETDVHVVVLDIKMPGRNGLETLKELRRLRPEIGVVVLSMYSEDQYALRVLRAGAAGYVTKECAPDELVAAIRKAIKGEKFIGPKIAELLAKHVDRNFEYDPHKLLSDREYEVLCHLASGKGLTDISIEMNLSVKTISTYRTRIVEKTGLTSNAEMTRYAIDHSLI